MAVQARTLEIYAKMGVVDEALSLGAIGAGANMWANGRWTARIPVGEMGQDLSPYPFVLMLGQDENERILGASLAREGVDIAWNTELTALEQHPNHVEVTLKQPNGTSRNIRAKWVAGCDGSRSPVRELCQIGFPGAPYAQTFFVADTAATGSMKPDELNVYLWQDGFHLFFPMRGQDRWRVIGILPEHLRQRDDVRFEDVVAAIQLEAGSDLAFHECSWFSTYKIHHRAAERFRDRRCFLLGDAAHVHSPMGAQGMNTGLQDAYNLAWKLALVVQGRADARLLDTYEQERIPVAQQLLETTDRAFQMVVSDGWLPRFLRTKVIARVAAAAMTFARVRRLAFRTISQIGIHYPNSMLTTSRSGLPKTAPSAGDRFPWLKLEFGPAGSVTDLYREFDDRQFNLLIFGQPADFPHSRLAYGDLLRVHVISQSAHNTRELARTKIPQTSYYLLRPDGHVGLCGAQLNSSDVMHYLASHACLNAHVAQAEAA
jgi:2-polyprenyl-6-methoxyphenol hydroxylase-like FAD-dependent oxidoreductase